MVTVETNSNVFDIEKIRKDFPVLGECVHGKPLVYLDNASTTQKPRCVIDTVKKYYSAENSNVHRGIHFLSEQATFAYEKARGQVKRFINAASEKEIVFLRGTTEAINLVARTFGNLNIEEGDEIILSTMEHHSNIVPWQIIANEKKAVIRVIPINDKGELILEEYKKLLNKKTKIVSVVYVSNVLGTVNPVKEIIELAHENNVPCMLDAAQAVSHMTVDVSELDCDFFAFSGHKIFGPTGIGVLYGKEEWLDRLPPYQGGGDMIKHVTFEKTLYQDIPYKFEAGTPNIAGAIGLGTAIYYIQNIGLASINRYERKLTSYAMNRLSGIKGLRLIGTADDKTSVISFVMDCAHAHDIGTILDREGVAIRTGHHCSQPIMDFFKVPATARASLSFYNTEDDMDKLVSALQKVREVFE